MYCSNCGKEVPASGIFCQYCGARQELAEQANMPVAAAQPEVYQAQTGAYAPVAAAQPEAYQAQPGAYAPQAAAQPEVYQAQPGAYAPQAAAQPITYPPRFADPINSEPSGLTTRLRVGSLIAFAGVAATLILSLFLIFATNEDLPLMKSTGLSFLGIGDKIVHVNENTKIRYEGLEDFFSNIYGFTKRDAAGFIVPDNSAVGIGIAVKIIYWAFCLLSVATLFASMISALTKKGATRASLTLAIFQVSLGLIVVAIAAICILVASSSFRMYTYVTQYYYLLIPLAITLAVAIWTRITLKKST